MLIPLRDGELEKLIRLSRQHGVVKAAFGRSGAAINTAETPWAAPLIAEWRGETFTSGAGI